MIKDLKVVDCLLIAMIFFRILYVSLFKENLGSLGLLGELGLSVLLLFMILMELLVTHNFMEKFLIIMVFFVLIIIYRNDVTIIFLLTNIASAMVIDYKSMLQDTFAGITLGVASVFILSLVGVLPKVAPEVGIFAFGFVNPNNTGFFLLEIYLLFIFFRWGKSKIINFVVLMFILGIEFLLLDDITAVVLLLILFVLFFFQREFNWLFETKIIRAGILFLPIFLFGLTMWIAKNFVRYSWMVRLNEFLSTRPFLWNYYLMNYHFSLTGIGTDILEITDKTLDNAYLNYLLLHGILIFMVIMSILLIGLYSVLKEKNYSLIVIIVIMLAVSFTETIPFRPFESFLLPLLSCYFFKEISINNRITKS